MPIETINMPDDDFDYEQEMKEGGRATECRALYREAYIAALGGYCASGNAENEYTAVTFSRETALETVRQWDVMMEELEKEIGG